MRVAPPLAHGPFPRRGLAAMFDAGSAHVRSIPTGVARRIALPPPPTGRHLLSRMALEEHPVGQRWDAPEYETVTPWTCVFEEVSVFGDGGIVLAGGEVVGDTLAHCEPGRQWFAAGEGVVTLFSAEPARKLEGAWLSLLGGGHWNFYHWLTDGIGRLAAADAAILAGCSGVLVPAHPVAVAAETMARAGIARGREVRAVEPWEAFACERLVVPWAMAELYRPHPRLASFLAALVTPPPPGKRRRIYVDRSAAANRVLANEAEVIAGLARFGVVPVVLEGRTLAEQALLFADAELVVAPHGAGLANIVFAPRDCRVVELLPNAYANWCFRRLAAACGLAYDCAIGLAEPGEGSIHARAWRMAPTHVQAAVAAALAPRG